MDLETSVKKCIETSIERDRLHNEIEFLRNKVYEEKLGEIADEELLDKYRRTIQKTLCNFEDAKRQAIEEKRIFNNILNESTLENGKQVLKKLEEAIGSLSQLIDENGKETKIGVSSRISYCKTYHYYIASHFGLQLLPDFIKKLKS